MERKTVYIAGLGLIGASLALGIRRAHPEIEILGYNRSEESRRVALERGMVDRVTDDFVAFAPLADVIILAVPIKQTIAFIKDLAELDLKEMLSSQMLAQPRLRLWQLQKSICRISPSALSELTRWPEVTRPEPRLLMSIYLKTPIISSRPLA